MKFRFPLATSSWDKSEFSALQRVIRSENFSMGVEVEKFEEKFAEYLGVKHTVMVNSGSSANLLMIAALRFTENLRLRLRPGDEVIVPSVSWSTTYYPLAQYGLHLKFVDIDLETLNYDISALKDAVTESTRAIMAVNLLGNPNDFEALNEIIEQHGIVLVEDNCESLGAKFQGKYAGTFGVMGTFSCFFSHHISTMEGGVVATDDEELYHIILALRAHGWTRNLPTRNHVTGLKSSNPFEESFNFVLPGYNLRPLEMSGAVGVEQLRKLPQLITGRRKNAALIKNKLEGNPTVLTQREIGESSWFGFSLVLRPESGVTRPEMLNRLNTVGFECRPIVGGDFTKNPVMKHIDHSIHGRLKNAEYIDKYGLFIGNHHYPMVDAIEALDSVL